MKYRKFGDQDWEVSALGFGAMRLPTNSNNEEDIDEKQAIEMIRYAIDHGVNYIDTAWPYHGGNSEAVVARALEDGYRDQVKLATKLPSWLIKEPADMDKYLNKQLERLQTDHIDFYLLHALDKKKWDNLKQVDVFSWVEKTRDEGKIDNIGFSFHDDYVLFEEIIKSYDWDFCQIQYNYLDTEFQAGRKGLKLAADRGIPVVVMEPLRGGDLAAEPPKEAKQIMNEVEADRTPADWALQWLWDQPEVTTVLSGMSNLQQVKENIESACNSGVNILSEKEREMLERAGEKFHGPIACTRCGYCMPCPNGVDIPENFYLYNMSELYDKYEVNKREYFDKDEGVRASACIECGECEPKCPQQLPIISLLKDVADYFEG